MLTTKAQLLYADLTAMGGGKLEEALILARTGLSHGSFSAARRELVEAEKLRLEKEGRQTVYVLTPQNTLLPEAGTQHILGAGEAEPQRTVEGADGVMMAAVEEMPRVTGDFAGFDDWEEALMKQLGSCLDISEGLLAGEYTVYSHDYEQEASYAVRVTDGGIRVT